MHIMHTFTACKIKQIQGVPGKGDAVREGVQGMAAGREADKKWPGKGDTVAASSSLLNLKQKGTPIADTVLKKNLLRQWRQKWPAIGDTVDIFF